MIEEARIRRKKIIRDGLFILLSLLVAILIFRTPTTFDFFRYNSGLTFFAAAFAAGILFSSTFSVAIASSIFFLLGNLYNPFLVAAIGGLGALVGNTFIFKLLREDLVRDFEYLEGHFGKKIARRIFHSKLIFWFVPIVAALMIASPIPDEIGLILLAGINLKYRQFFVLSIFLNTFGILLLALFGKII